MNIGKDWKIEADELNVGLLRRHTRKADGSTYWQPYGYYSTVANALQGLVDVEVKQTALKDLETVVKKIDELYEWISRASEDARTVTKNRTIPKRAPENQQQGKFKFYFLEKKGA